MGSFRRQRILKPGEESETDAEDVEVANVLSSFPELNTGGVGLYDITALQIAAALTTKGISPTISRLIAFGEVNRCDQIGRSPLHYAAFTGNSELVRLLLNAGACTEVKFKYREIEKRTSREDYVKWNKLYATLPLPDGWGRTPLHLATKEGHLESMKLLIDANADVNSEDDRGITPLLLSGSTKDRKIFEESVRLLVEHGANVNKRNGVTGTTVLFHAVSLNSAITVKRLLKAGAWLTVGPCQQTELHEAAANGNKDILQIFLNDPRITRNDINRPDACKRTSAYRAALNGHKICLRMLLERGAYLGHMTQTKETVVDAIFCRVAKSADFIKELLDSRIDGKRTENDDNLYKITLDFTLLAPHENERQMDVITILLDAANEKDKIEILQHPLIESYLRLKWANIRGFFFLLVYIYVAFVLSLSLYVILSIHLPEKLAILSTVTRYFLIVTSCGLLGHAIIQCALSWRSFLRQYEMWMNMCCTLLSLIVASIGDSTFKRANIQSAPNWVLHATSIAVLLSWTQLMLLIGRFPAYGYYALMFASVLQNVVKVLLTFVCLVIGFALSFSVQFHNCDEFKDPWRALVKTTVMMTGEYEYESLFKDDITKPLPRLPVTSRLIFLMFIILASIVLMNLMVGLAVSDIQGLQQEGNVRRLEKQAQFLYQLEQVLSFNAIHAKWFPRWLRSLLTRNRSIATKLVVLPEQAGALKFEDKATKKLPPDLIESITAIADRRRKHTIQKSFQNDKLPHLIETMKLIISTYESQLLETETDRGADSAGN